jgi:uncharacterized UPF0146 family protein
MAKAAGKLQKKYWGAAAVLVIRPMTEIYQQVAALSKRLRPSLVTQILAISNEVTGNEKALPGATISFHAGPCG